MDDPSYALKRELCVLGEVNSPRTMAEDDLLPVSQTPDHLGSGAGAFDLYRIRIPYPPVPASVMIRHDLTPGGGSDRDPP